MAKQQKIVLGKTTIETSAYANPSRTVYVTSDTGKRTVISASLLDAIAEYQTTGDESWLRTINVILRDNVKILRDES